MDRRCFENIIQIMQIVRHTPHLFIFFGLVQTIHQTRAPLVAGFSSTCTPVFKANSNHKGLRLGSLNSQSRLFNTGADIEQNPLDNSASSETADIYFASSAAELASTAPPTTDIPLSAAALAARDKVNEIDFCIAPADVSLSRAYGIRTTSETNTAGGSNLDKGVELSLTRALNNASNRAVRRILLVRSWPSAEALNLSLRRVALAKKQREDQLIQQQGVETSKCPVPRPILNVLSRQQSSSNGFKKLDVKARSRTDEEYVADQIQSFKERYGSLPGFNFAEDYLASVLSLATSGIESDRAPFVLEGSLYNEAYKRILAALRTVGVQFRTLEDGRQVISPKLLDQDVCLSMLDKLAVKREAAESENNGVHASTQSPADPSTESKSNNSTRSFMFWRRPFEKADDSDKKSRDSETDDLEGDSNLLGKLSKGILVSNKEPTITRQLNTISNVVQRALLFGGDQELLVLAETLEADRSALVHLWCKESDEKKGMISEGFKGLQYFDCLILLLRKCYTDGVVTDLNPSLPLSSSYANAYERLVASAVELGSGYMKPTLTADATAISMKPSLSGSSTKSLPKPRTAQEGIGRFAIWESTARQRAASTTSSVSAYPTDMEGTWEIRDEVGGKIIGSSIVTLLENGNVKVSPPLEGLRWRLDPGPTHLDTCTFQVLASDGTVLQYRGFIDRGARLEARFSKRPIKVRGSVMFQMRDGGGTFDYYRDILPINYRQGTTKFVMTKQIQ